MHAREVLVVLAVVLISVVVHSMAVVHSVAVIRAAECSKKDNEVSFI